MTVNDARNDLLGLIGIEAETHMPALVGTRILSDINATLQKLWTMAAPWWTTTTTGVFLNAPTGVSGLTVTKGSKTVTTGGTGTLPTWSEGCAIRIDGDPKDNEIVTRDASNTTVTLALPYAGASGAGKSATVYGDAVTLAETESSVQPPVILVGEHELIALRGQRDIASFGSNIGHNRGPGSMVATLRDVDTPLGYYVDRATNANGRVLLRLRVSPLPDREYTVSYETRGEAPRFTSLVGDGIKEIPVPQNYAESIFLPLLRFQFSTWRHFEAADILPQLKAQYEEAWQVLAKLKPQPARAGQVRVRPDW